MRMLKEIPRFEITEDGGQIPRGAFADSNGCIDLCSSLAGTVVLWVPRAYARGDAPEAVGQTLDGLRPANEAARAMLFLLAHAGNTARRML